MSNASRGANVIQFPTWRIAAPLVTSQFRWEELTAHPGDRHRHGVWVGDTWTKARPGFPARLWTFRIAKERLPGRTRRIGWRWVLYVSGACVGVYPKKGDAACAAHTGSWR